MRKAETIGIVQPGEEKTLVSFNCGLPVLRKLDRGFLQEHIMNRTRRNDFTLKMSRFRSDIRNKFFAVMVVRRWNMLPKEAVDVSSLEMFKARIDLRTTWSGGRCLCPCVCTGGLDLDDL